MGKLTEPTTGLIDKGSTFLEKSTPEELAEYYRISRQQVVDARKQGGVEGDDGLLKSKERFCKDYKREQTEKTNREKYTSDRRARKAGRGYDDRSFRLTKPTDKRNDNEDTDI